MNAEEYFTKPDACLIDRKKQLLMDVKGLRFPAIEFFEEEDREDMLLLMKAIKDEGDYVNKSQAVILEWLIFNWSIRFNDGCNKCKGSQLVFSKKDEVILSCLNCCSIEYRVGNDDASGKTLVTGEEAVNILYNNQKTLLHNFFVVFALLKDPDFYKNILTTNNNLPHETSKFTWMCDISTENVNNVNKEILWNYLKEKLHVDSIDCNFCNKAQEHLMFYTAPDEIATCCNECRGIAVRTLVKADPYYNETALHQNNVFQAWGNLIRMGSS